MMIVKRSIIFNRFLKEKHCYNQYYYNVHKDLSYSPIYKLLSEAFNWQCSPEGDTFWRALNSEWLAIIQSLGMLKD